MNLEEQLMLQIIREEDIELERGLLIASGCGTEEEIAAYKEKISGLDKRFRIFNLFREHDKEWTAYSLTRFIWGKKGRKYKRERFRLTDVIDALVTGDDDIGNCRGRTCLYTALGVRSGLEISVVINPKHVYSSMAIGSGFVDIENARDDGYGEELNANGHEAKAKSLIALLFNSRGAEIENLNWKMAELYFRYAYIADPHNPITLINFGKVLEKQGMTNPAIDIYTKAIEADPTYAKPYSKRANLTMKSREAAMRDINKAIELEPANAEHFIIKGCIYWHAGEYGKAKKQYERAAFLEPGNATAYYNLGIMGLNKGDLDSAIENLRQASALDNTHFPKIPGLLADAYSRRANACSIFGEHEQAKADRLEAGRIKEEIAIKERKEKYT